MKPTSLYLAAALAFPVPQLYPKSYRDLPLPPAAVEQSPMTQLLTEFTVALDAETVAAFYKAQFTKRGLFLANPRSDKRVVAFHVKASQLDGHQPGDLEVEIRRKGAKRSVVSIRDWKLPER